MIPDRIGGRWGMGPTADPVGRRRVAMLYFVLVEGAGVDQGLS